jgi:hypothetical protein
MVGSVMNFKKFLTIPEVRALIDKNTKMPKYKIESEMKAEPLTTHYILVGIAFDYFIRFYLKRENQEIDDPIWKAEINCNTKAGGKLEISNHKLINRPDRFMYYGKVPRKDEKEIKILIDYLNSAQFSYHKYLKNGIISDEVIKSCFLLAKIESSFNDYVPIDSDFGKIEAKDIEDLRNLINTLSPEHFYFRNTCQIKPPLEAPLIPDKITEADLIIDDTIIDVKVTKEPRLTREMFRQLTAYFILHNYSTGTYFKIKNKDVVSFSINKMGVYFARHGILYKFNAEDVFLPSAPEELVRPLFRQITKYDIESGTKTYDSDFKCYR